MCALHLTEREESVRWDEVICLLFFMPVTGYGRVGITGVHLTELDFGSLERFSATGKNEAVKMEGERHGQIQSCDS